MSCFRVLLAIIFPPLAVVDKGCGSFLITFILTLCGWVPGVIAAIVILNKNKDDSGYNQGYNRGFNQGYSQGQQNSNFYGNNNYRGGGNQRPGW